MLFDENKYNFMFEALKLAEIAFDEDEVPIGAVVVKDNKIIGKGYNQVEKLNDATAHAEIIAITSSTNNIKSKKLDGCD
jgi:tRNA(adenine34) deaminase